MSTSTSLKFRVASITAAVLAVAGPVHAAEGDLASKITPDSSVEVGAGYVDSDNGNFGKYNGLNEKGWYLLLDGDIKVRDDATGSWMQLRGRNLGLDSRELRWDQSRQGNWSYYLEYDEIPRFEPLTVTTPVQGIGGTNLTCVGAPAAGCPGGIPTTVDIESKRKRYSLGFDKAFASKWGVSVDFRTETKKGERLFGVGGPSNFSFAPEPLDSTIDLLDASIRYTEKQFQLVGGFFGTQYKNDFTAFNVNYGAAGNNGSLVLNPISLPPDNQSWQIYLNGGYSFNPTTRGTFKVSYQQATQNAGYIDSPTLPGTTDLGANVETTLVQAGISARPMPKLSLLGNLRYYNRDDKTSVNQYFMGSGTTTGINEPRSYKDQSAKVEAGYDLPKGFRVIGVVDYDQKNRNTYPYRSVSHRDKTEEWAYTAAVRRTMSETLTGGLSYTYADRDGSGWYPNLSSPTNTPIDNLPTPIHYADRKQDKVRLTLNWVPVTPLAVGFYLDDITDKYDGIYPQGPQAGVPAGPRKGEQRVYAIDAAYSINQMWQATAWYSYNEYKYQNTTAEYDDESKSKGNAYGVGVRGKPHQRVEVGADYSYNDIQDTWTQNPLAGFPVIPQLPDVTTRLTRLKLFGKYAIDKRSGIRLDYIYDRYSTNDQTWSAWVAPPGAGYWDGTVVSEPSPQVVNFIGLRYFYNFH